MCVQPRVQMQIFIKDLQSRTIVLQITEEMTGFHLRSIVAAALTVNATDIRLSVNSHPLKDLEPLIAQGVSDNSTIDTNGRLLGGSYGRYIAGGVASGATQGVVESCCTIA